MAGPHRLNALMTHNQSISEIKILKSLDDVRAQYDALLCDIWGVIHNGREPYSAAVDILHKFRGEGGVVVLLSNSPRPASAIPAQFTEIGVPNTIYDSVVTSGDATQAEMRPRVGQSVFHIGPPRDLPLFEGIDLKRTELASANFVLCSGLFDDETETPDDYQDLLTDVRAQDLMMICANPDKVVVRGDNKIFCAGAIAAAYEKMGGEVIYAGKPHQPIFELAFGRVQKISKRPIGKDRILMVGDGPATDILGADRFGLDSLFVGGGIHADECFKSSGDLNAQGLSSLFGELGFWPDFAMPWFQ